MSISELWRRLLHLFRRERVTEELEEEMRLHVELRADANRRVGMSAGDAESAARRRFGNRGALEMASRDAWGLGWLDSLAQDIRYALRTARRTPGFTAAAVITLALGIGANTTMFGVVDTLLFKPPAHVRGPDSVVRVYFGSTDAERGSRVEAQQGYDTYTEFRDHVHGFDAVAAYSSTRVSVGSGTDARDFAAVLATPSFFSMLGVRPALGRFFADDEERADRDKVAVLGYDAWRAKFAADSGVLGRTIDVSGERYSIIGVAPKDFTGVDLSGVELWLPIGAATSLFSKNALTIDGGHSFWLSIVGRRRPGVSDGQLAAEATAVYLDSRRSEPMFERFVSKSRVVVGPILAGRGPDASADVRVSAWLGAVSLIVLLIACANVTNLLLARGLVRSREMAIRLSLGASRGRLAQQVLVEGVLLALMGAACAMLVATWSSSAVRAFIIPDVPLLGAALDWRLWVFAAVIALGTGILAAAAPAFAALRRDFGSSLKVSVPGSRGSQAILRRALVCGQVALTVLLLIGSGLFVKSLRNVQAIDLGLDVDHLLYARVDLASRGMSVADANARYTAMLERVRRLPGVRSASLTGGEPLASGWGISLRVPGGEPPRQGDASPFGQAVGARYFETMGATLRQGRFFIDADQSPASHVAIVDERTAKHYWPHGGAVGACAHLGSDTVCTEIVGIIANTVRWQITGESGFTAYAVYVPLESEWTQRVSMMEVRASGDPATLVDAVRHTMQSSAPDTPFADVQPLSQRLEPQMRPWRLGASMFSAFGALALALAAIGLYGVLSYMVAQRTREIGIRKALGARDGDVVSMVVGSALGVTILGVVAGVLAALPAGRLVASQLYGESARDPLVFVAGGLVLTLVALAASFVPALRAASVDPMVALQSE